MVSKLAGTRWKADYTCKCGSNIFIHEGTDGSDGFTECWWNGTCAACGKHYEMSHWTKCQRMEGDHV